MRAPLATGRIRATALVTGVVGLVLAGCGTPQYTRQPKAPVALQLSGVITSTQITVSPDAFGAGPIVLVVSNEDRTSHTVSLVGEGIQEHVGPINPGDTATLQKTLQPGSYVVKAGSERALPRELSPATLNVGPRRMSGSDHLTFP